MDIQAFFSNLARQMRSPRSDAKGEGVKRARRRKTMAPLSREAQRRADDRYRKIRVTRARRWLRNQADDNTSPPAHIERTLRECV